MALFDWNDEYSVNVMAMDNHHKKLFDILNQMHDAMKAGSGEEAAARIINELIDYTKYHFSEEEKMMEQINYAGIDAQKRAHQAFIDKMLEYKKDVDEGMAIFTVSKVSRTGVSWLKEHILVMDNKYTEPANEGGFR